MANHVYSQFDIKFVDAKDCTKFLQWLGYETDPTKYPENSTYMSRIEAMSNCFFDSLWPELPDTRDAWIDQVGAKWCYLEDADASDDTVYLRFTSAWDFPEGLFYKLSDFLREMFPHAKIQGTFDDEGYCFVGAFAANQQFRDIEYFYPEDEFFDDPTYREEDGCWTDPFYDEMSNKKDELLDEVLSFTEQSFDGQ